MVFLCRQIEYKGWIKMNPNVHCSTSTAQAKGAYMATGKTATLTFRIDPGLKEALRHAAHLEHRSIANMVEVMIRDHCQRNNIPIPEQQALFTEDDQ